MIQWHRTNWKHSMYLPDKRIPMFFSGEEMKKVFPWDEISTSAPIYLHPCPWGPSMSFTAAPQRTRPDVPAAKHSWPKCVEWGQDQGAQLSASLQTCKQCLQFSFVLKSHTQNASGVLVSHVFMLSAYKIFFSPFISGKWGGKFQ